MMESRWENEGGKAYEKVDFSVVNPRYFEFADRRIRHLVDAGIVPVIVGGWGRPQGGGQSTLMQVGLDGFKRHWRNLIARYGAYPTVWIVGGEAKDAYGPWLLHHWLVPTPLPSEVVATAYGALVSCNPIRS